MAERGEPIKVGVRELRGRLSEYLRQAQSGARFTIMSRGEAMAELSAPPASEDKQGPRKLGALEGKVRFDPDWDQWPDDVRKSFEAPL
jgi:antitoxin (DNA-binding transcriptional repressor) of toxin-antitoxin stability system